MPGRELLQIPGPTNIPDAVLEAFRRPPVDFTGADYATWIDRLWVDLRAVFDGADDVVCYPAVGHGAWDGTFANLCEPGARVLVPVAGVFAGAWAAHGEALGLDVVRLPGDERRPLDPAAVHDALAADAQHRIAAVCVTHVETATGARTDLAAMRDAIDTAGHPALFVVDAVASLATESLSMGAWGIDAVISASQKGLMMPPGLSFVAVSAKARAVAERTTTPRAYWSWANRFDPAFVYQRFGGTPPEQHLFALRAVLDLIAGEGGMGAVVDRHRRLAGAVRAAVEHWGSGGPWELQVVVPEGRANGVTGVRCETIDAEAFREAARRHGVVVASALGELAGRGVRIGHLGDASPVSVLGALAGLELAMASLGLPHQHGGVRAAIEALAAGPSPERDGAAVRP